MRNKTLIVRVAFFLGLLISAVWLADLIFFRSSPLGAYGQLGDEAIVIRGAQRIIEGQIPHRDFLSLLGGGTYYPLALFFKFFGDGLNVVRAFNFFNAFAICLALVWLSWPLLRYASVFCSLFFAGVIFPMWPYVSHHWMFLLVAILSTGLVARRKSDAWLALAGLMTGGIAFTIHPKAALLAIAHLAFLLIVYRNRPRRWQSFCIYLAGVVFASLAGLLFLVGVGGFREFIRQVFVVDLLYYKWSANNSFFALNGIVTLLLISIVIAFFPLTKKRWLSVKIYENYLAIFLVFVAMCVSISYFLEITHFVQVIAFAITLNLFGIIFFARCYFLQKKSWTVMVPSIITGVWFLGMAIYLCAQAYTVGSFGALADQEVLSTPKGQVYLNQQWISPVVDEVPLVLTLMKTTYAGQKFYFLPYAPGYFYLGNVKNTTSFEFIATNTLVREDFVKIKDELHRQVDTVFYLPQSWLLFYPDNELMDWIRNEFPYTRRYLNGRIVTFSKYEIPPDQVY